MGVTDPLIGIADIVKDLSAQGKLYIIISYIINRTSRLNILS